MPSFRGLAQLLCFSWAISSFEGQHDFSLSDTLSNSHYLELEPGTLPGPDSTMAAYSKGWVKRPPATLPPILPSQEHIVTITLPSLNLDEEDEDPKIVDTFCLASYNWLVRGERTILIPGIEGAVSNLTTRFDNVQVAHQGGSHRSTILL